jgi:hypothetical protein
LTLKRLFSAGFIHTVIAGPGDQGNTWSAWCRDVRVTGRLTSNRHDHSEFLAALATTEPEVVCRHHSQNLRIMPPPKPFVPFPVHFLGLQWKIIEHAGAASKLLTDFLRIDDVAVTRHSLSC